MKDYEEDVSDASGRKRSASRSVDEAEFDGKGWALVKDDAAAQVMHQSAEIAYASINISVASLLEDASGSARWCRRQLGCWCTLASLPARELHIVFWDEGAGALWARIVEGFSGLQQLEEPETWLQHHCEGAHEGFWGLRQLEEP